MSGCIPNKCFCNWSSLNWFDVILIRLFTWRKHSIMSSSHSIFLSFCSLFNRRCSFIYCSSMPRQIHKLSFVWSLRNKRSFWIPRRLILDLIRVNVLIIIYSCWWSLVRWISYHFVFFNLFLIWTKLFYLSLMEQLGFRSNFILNLHFEAVWKAFRNLRKSFLICYDVWTLFSMKSSWWCSLRSWLSWGNLSLVS